MRSIILCSLLFWLGSGAPSRAAEAEAELFSAAAAAFTNRFYERAEQQFADFIAKHAASSNVPAAILYQAQARFFQRKHDGALELLRKEAARAGALADQFQFWQAEALFEKGEFNAAAENYALLPKNHPQSPLALRASYLQAYSQFQQKNFAAAVELLRNEAGAFRQLAKTNAQDMFALRGQLLLGEAHLAAGQLDDARAALAAIGPLPDKPELDWERHQLLARVEFASPKPEAALPHLTNAIAAGASAQRPPLQAQSWNLEAETHKKLGQTDAAVTAYERIATAPALALDQRRLAVLKSVELLSGAGRLTNAIVRLEAHLAANTNEPAADLLRLKAGELWLDQFRALTAASNAPATALTSNALEQARTQLALVIAQTNSAQAGRAWLNLGWSFWEEGTRFENPDRVRESEAAFRGATERLARSDEQALALFKLADAQLQLGRPLEAATNYMAVLRDFGDLPQARNSLFDRTHRQLVRSFIEAGDLGRAAEKLAEHRQAFGGSALFEDALYLYGRALARAGRHADARAVFQDFLKSFPGSPLASQARFSESRTYAGEGQWAVAIEKLGQWLAAYPTNQMRAEAEFQRALLHDQAGNRTNALALFTNFVAQFPVHPLAPAAQNWVADYFYEQEQWQVAEQNYQRIFQNTNWAASRFFYPARLMAARTAFFREGYDDARSYLTNILQDAKCPAELLPEAWFALGDVFISQPIVGSTNAVANFVEAAKVFNRIVNQFPTNKLAPLALARKGDCHAMLAEFYPESFKEALESYGAVVALKPPAVPVAARNQAQVGLALLLKRSAEGKPAEERAKLLRQALDQLLDVVYETGLNGEPADPFYLKKAGLEAGRLAEAGGDTAAALELYRRLAERAPSLRAFWEARIASLQQRAASDQVPRIN